MQVMVIGFIVFGVIFSIIGIWLIIKDRKTIKNCTEITKGKIIDVICNDRWDSNGHYYVYENIYEYYIGNEKFTRKMKISTNRYRKGEEIDIYYNPKNIDEHYVKKDRISLALGITSLIIGIAIIVVFIKCYIKIA